MITVNYIAKPARTKLSFDERITPTNKYSPHKQQPRYNYLYSITIYDYVEEEKTTKKKNYLCSHTNLMRENGHVQWKRERIVGPPNVNVLLRQQYI